MKRLLDYDPITGITQYHEYDSVNDVTTISTHQDVEPILDANKRLQNNEDYKKLGMKQEMWHYARIPIVLVEKWLREDGIDVFNPDHSKKVFQKLNSSDYAYLRTTTGKHA